VKNSNKTDLIRIISDFNAGPFSGLLTNKLGNYNFEIVVTPYGQVFQTLASPSESWLDIVWTTPERCLPTFNKACQLEEIDEKSVLYEVEIFADSLIAASENRKIFVAAWILPPNTGYGMLDWRNSLGLSNLLAKCNLFLAEKIKTNNNIYMLPTHSWVQEGANSISKKMWYATKVLFVTEVFERAVKHIVNYIDAIKGKSRRLIIIDLDDTIWGGVVGENGWQGIRLGGHDYIGEAFKDFQLALKALSNRGIQLAISSKNDEIVALEAIDRHPEMILKKSDFAGWRINWHDKASNISDLANEVRLGFESIVFIDDNPAERSLVAEALPEVLVPPWPKDPAEYVGALNSLGCFETPLLNIEDRKRTIMYVAERARRNIKNDIGNIDGWLKKLGTQVTSNHVNQDNISRVTQLFNKTNQLNLSTRRLSQEEILNWLANKNRSMLAISVSDQFGDSGLVGVVSVEASGDRGQLVDFILSCRVMGRQIEQTLIHLAVSELASLGAKVMEIVHLPTDRNRPTLEVLEKSNLEKIKDNEFKVNIVLGYKKPDFVELKYNV
tara:strand:+ start:10621 stop:12285 length:1665 start_codon:yes stop_codon:yes gene_type:complete